MSDWPIMQVVHSLMGKTFTGNVTMEISRGERI